MFQEILTAHSLSPFKVCYQKKKSPDLKQNTSYFKILRIFILSNNSFIVYLFGSSEEKILLTCLFLRYTLFNPCKQLILSLYRSDAGSQDLPGERYLLLANMVLVLQTAAPFDYLTQSYFNKLLALTTKKNARIFKRDFY